MKNLFSKIIIIVFLFTVTNAYAVEDYHIARLYEKGAFKGKQLIYEWRIDEALELAKELIKDDPGSKGNRYLMCLALFYNGEYEEALDYFDDPGDDMDKKQMYAVIRATYEQTKGFVSKESEHFIVLYKPDSKDYILADQSLQTLEGAYKNLGEDLGFYPASKLRVEIYPNIKSFTAVSTLTKEDVETSGTIALCKYNRLMITSPRALLRGYRWQRTLSHEYIHYLVYNLSSAAAPIWLHEGIAKYLEDRFDSETLGAMSPSAENILSRRLKTDSFITLEEMSPSMAKLKSDEDVALAFAEVNSIIDYMVKKKGFDAVKSILKLMSQGKEDYQAVQEVFGASLVEFQNDWIADLKKSGLKEIPGMLVKGPGVKLKSSDELSDEAIESEELKQQHNKDVTKYVNLGNLLRDRGRVLAASYEYKKAYDEDNFSIIALTKLAHSYILIEDFDNALRVLYEALELYPDYVTTYSRLGIVYMMKEEYEKSLKFFDESISINPFISFVREDMAHIYTALGMDEKAKEQQEILEILKGH